LILASLRFRVSRLLLAANGAHKHRIKFRNVSIQRDITAYTTPAHEFSKAPSGRPTDQRIAFGRRRCQLLDRSPRSADVTAIGAVECRVLTRDAFAMLDREAPAIKIRLLENLRSG
jgi:hypothetical protein